MPPLDFVENLGQWDQSAAFVARGGPLTARLGRDRIELRHAKGPQAPLALAFEGASPGTTLVGEGRRRGYYNFFVGADPRGWRPRVAAYAGVLYRGLYNGVDMRLREAGGRLEYDLLVAAGADVAKIVVRADGASGLEVAADGSLLIQTGAGALRQSRPVTWEELPGGERRMVECRFRKIDSRRYGFEVVGRGRGLPLVIDPGLEWATYLGGGNWDEIHDIAAAGDGTGDVIAVGATLSQDFTGRPNAVAGFVTRFSATGALVYKTILVGSDREWVRGVAVAAGGEPVVVGESYSPDYPTTPGAYDTTHGVRFDALGPIYGADAFVTRLSAGGDRLVYSTFVGTDDYEQAVAVALAPGGTAVVVGETTSAAWPTTEGAFDRTHNCCTPYFEGVFSARDAFVARLSADGSALEYSTYLGGFGDELPKSVVVDAAGFVTLTGDIYSSPDASAPNFPTTSDALARTPHDREGINDTFLTRMRLDGAGAADLKYSTFIGGNSNEHALAVALDPFNPQDVLVGGVTYSTAGVPAIFPTTAGTLKPSSTSIDGFVMRWRFPAAGGGSLVWSTLFGGLDYEEVADLAVDSDGSIVLSGETRSFDFPTTQGAFDRSVAISSGVLWFDAYAARISADGARVLYGTYLGGAFNDRHVKVALVAPNTTVLAGWTLSGDFPVTPGAHDGVLNNDGVGGAAGGPGGTQFDGFLARLTLLPDGDGDDAVAAPTLLGPADGSFQPTLTTINFDWSDVADPSGLDGYNIQLNQRSDFVCCNDWQEVWTKNSDWRASVRFEGPYYWRVRTADRSGNLSEWSEVRSFNSGAGVSTLMVNPPSVSGGNPSQGEVTLTSTATPGGAVVSLRSSNTAVATVPASVTIPSGSNLARFTVSTRAVSATTNVAITATYGSTSKSVTLTVTPSTAPPAAPTLVSPANNVQLPPGQSITFSWNAVAGAATYEFQVDDSSSFSAPLVVSRPGLAQTQTAQTFTSERRYWWRVRGRTAGGTNGAWSSARSFEIKRGAAPAPAPGPATLSALSLNPTGVTGGNSSQGTVTLTGAAPSGGAVVTLTSSNTAAATVPASVTVAAGSTAATFTVTTKSVSASTSVTISAAYGGVTRSATLSVAAAPAPTPTPTPTPTPSTDTVAVQVAEYSSGNQQLRVEATSTNSSATLRAYVTSTNALIGTLRNEGGGRYRGDFSWPSNPQSVTVRSSLGGSATRAVTVK
ncbi:MAG TPA: hypothetical protein VG148_10320 [Pyrinomonadaceae bacterium]|nr:hypothetical protein [Pyrinomonadaceae bacterium]